MLDQRHIIPGHIGSWRQTVARSVFTNDEYKAIIPLRDVAFKEVQVLIAE